MRYAIYGAGSLGTVLGAYITQNGGTIDLINRNRAHVEALIDELAGERITFAQYPRRADFLYELRRRVNAEISGIAKQAQ